MYLIVGLGNPGRDYAGTRHNVGFSAIAELSDVCGILVNTRKHKALTGNARIGGNKALLAMPQTYMNLSGESVRAMVDYYQIDPEKELIVIYDDVSLDVGQLRIRKKGSAGGHNGMKNIIRMLGTDVFTRIRVGVGAKPEKTDLADYVLGHFAGEEQEAIREAVKEAAEAVTTILTDGADAAMNRYNQAKKKKEG
ncbi:MAG: aminoacyl-tRNA hydrolase [Lachnospiraceae bacterium]|nr:aminoacyl-tRNA hydrolase [Lachnospiraceae bacterium]